MLTAYLDIGKNVSKVNRIVNVVSLLNGSDIMADLIARDFNSTDEFVHSYYFPIIMETLSSDAGLGHLINILVRIIPKRLFNAMVSASYGALHKTVLKNNPQF